MHPLKYSEKLEMSFKKRFAEKFYSCIEFTPGEFTDGVRHKNMAATRTLLGRTEVEGKTCADVAAVDAWCPILMHRRGAARIAAFDRNDFTPLINKVRDALGVELDYFPLLKSSEISEKAIKAGFDGFDVVVNSGLLYHVLGPINSLASSRSLVKTGGILIVETVVDTTADGFSMRFNHSGSISPNDPTYFWQVSVKMYEYMLRMLRLEPLDVCWYRRRMAIACRAVDYVPAAQDDNWVTETYKARDILDFTDWSILDKCTKVAYDRSNVIESSAGGIDVWEAFKAGHELSKFLVIAIKVFE